MKKHFTIDQIQNFIGSILEFRTCTAKYVDDAGVSTEVYKLVRDEDIFYLRIASEGENMSSEALVHKLLAEKGVKVPKVLCFEDFNKKLGKSYMITGELVGVPLKKDRKATRKSLIEVGKQLALINSIPVKGFGWLDRNKPDMQELVGCYSTYEEFALNQERISNMLDYLVEREVFSYPLSDKYLRYVNDHKDLLAGCDQAYLAHGDFSATHIFFKNGEYVGIIDFGDIRCTSIYHDLAHFYTYNREYFEDVFKGYKAVKKLESGYMSKIEFVAMLFAVGKLWWVAKNIPKKLTSVHPALFLVKSVLKVD